MNDSVHRFFKDGLAGFAVSLTLGVFTGALFYSDISSYIDVEDINGFIGKMVFFQKGFESPLPFVLLASFVGSGISGRLLENGKTNKNLPMFVLKNSAFAWLAGLGLIAIWDLIFAIVNNKGVEGLFEYINIVIVLTGFGAVVGFLIASIIGAILKPQIRLQKIIVGTVASAITGLVIGFEVFLSQIVR